MPGKESGDDPLFYEVNDRADHIGENQGCNQGRMFEDCGWEYLTEFDGYNYFRKPADKMQQKEEIFCDDISRLDMMNRIFIGRVIPLVVILCGLIWQLYISATDHSERGWLPVFMVLVVIYIIIFLQFAVKYFAFRKKVK